MIRYLLGIALQTSQNCFIDEIKLRSLYLAGKKGEKGEGFDVLKSGDARVAMIGFPSVGKYPLFVQHSLHVSRGELRGRTMYRYPPPPKKRGKKT